MSGLIEGETGAQRLLGYVLDVGRGDGRARCRMVVEERHTNRTGILHGGLTVAMLDNAMGATGSLALDPEGLAPMMTLTLTCSYLAPARLGDALEAEGWIEGGGRSVKFIGGRVTRDDGTVVATATGVFKPARRPDP